MQEIEKQEALSKQLSDEISKQSKLNQDIEKKKLAIEEYSKEAEINKDKICEGADKVKKQNDELKSKIEEVD